MREYRTGSKTGENLIKVYLNDKDDCIYLNPDDATFITKYTGIVKWLDERGAAYDKSVEAWEKKYKNCKIIEKTEDGHTKIDTDQILELAELRTQMCRECCERIDMLFGEGTVKKYFRVIYEEMPDFVPDEDCIYDFFEEMGPIVGDIFNSRLEGVRTKYNRNRRGKHTRTKEELISEYKEKKEDEAGE